MDVEVSFKNKSRGVIQHLAFRSPERTTFYTYSCLLITNLVKAVANSFPIGVFQILIAICDHQVL
jgi:hypothetical protein